MAIPEGYFALVDGIEGVNGLDIIEQIKLNIPFLTIDYLYINFRIIFPASDVYIPLTIDVIRGPVSLNLTDPVAYFNLSISNSNKSGDFPANMLNINGAIGSSILLNDVSININTNIIVPFDPFIPNVSDVP